MRSDKVIVGPNRGRSATRYVAEELPDGRWRLGHLVGGTLHASSDAAGAWAQQMAIQSGNDAEVLVVRRSAPAFTSDDLAETRRVMEFAAKHAQRRRA